MGTSDGGGSVAGVLLPVGDAVAAYQAGATIQRIAADAGSSYSRIRTMLLAAGVTLRRPGGRGSRPTETPGKQAGSGPVLASPAVGPVHSGPQLRQARQRHGIGLVPMATKVGLSAGYL